MDDKYVHGVKKGEDIPPEWQEKIDNGEAIAIKVEKPPISSRLLWINAALMVGLALVATFNPAIPSVLLIWGLVVANLFWAGLAAGLGGIAAQARTHLAVERAAFDALISKIREVEENIKGTFPSKDGLTNTDDSTDTVH